MDPKNQNTKRSRAKSADARGQANGLVVFARPADGQRGKKAPDVPLPISRMLMDGERALDAKVRKLQRRQDGLARRLDSIPKSIRVDFAASPEYNYLFAAAGGPENWPLPRPFSVGNRYTDRYATVVGTSQTLFTIMPSTSLVVWLTPTSLRGPLMYSMTNAIATTQFQLNDRGLAALDWQGWVLGTHVNFVPWTGFQPFRLHHDSAINLTNTANPISDEAALRPPTIQLAAATAAFDIGTAYNGIGAASYLSPADNPAVFSTGNHSPKPVLNQVARSQGVRHDHIGHVSIARSDNYLNVLDHGASMNGLVNLIGSTPSAETAIRMTSLPEHSFSWTGERTPAVAPSYVGVQHNLHPTNNPVYWANKFGACAIVNNSAVATMQVAYRSRVVCHMLLETDPVAGIISELSAALAAEAPCIQEHVALNGNQQGMPTTVAAKTQLLAEETQRHGSMLATVRASNIQTGPPRSSIGKTILGGAEDIAQGVGFGALLKRAAATFPKVAQSAERALARGIEAIAPIVEDAVSFLA